MIISINFSLFLLSKRLLSGSHFRKYSIGHGNKIILFPRQHNESGMTFCLSLCWIHDDVIKWKKIRVTGYLWGHKGQCRGVSIFSLICAWTNVWVSNRDAGDLRLHCAQYDATLLVLRTHKDMFALLSLIHKWCKLLKSFVEHKESFIQMSYREILRPQYQIILYKDMRRIQLDCNVAGINYNSVSKTWTEIKKGEASVSSMTPRTIGYKAWNIPVDNIFLI